MVPSFLAADPANVNMFIWLRLMSQLFLHKQSVTYAVFFDLIILIKKKSVQLSFLLMFSC